MITIYSTESIKEYFSDLHDNVCNQKYNKTLPYSFHLDMVYEQGLKFKYLIDNKFEKSITSLKDIWYFITVGLYGHDSIEDARLTYNDLVERYGEFSAEIIYLCTEDKGRNRSERKSNTWYQHLKINEFAVFVKLCDIIANVKFSLLTNSSMFNKYRTEYEQKVKPHLYHEDYKPMFDYLELLFKIN